MIQVPGYLIKREVGKGGMATVYLAVQTSLDREVALKVMQPALANDPNFSRRFLQEARTLASLSHPNIVAVYDVGVTEAQLHYFSMQHLPGGDFAHRIRDGVHEIEVVRVLAGVARALAFAHQRGFVHRDVSPANILFDASEHPVLTDFGIARAVARTSRLTNAGVSVGTSHYMSPEQARGADVDARSDIYSLGCVAYEALVRKPPYSGEDGFAIAYAHVFEPVPRLPPTLSHWQPLVDRALAKNAADRFASCEEFLEALAGVGAAPLPSEPKPEPEVYDDSDFASFTDANATNQIPAALLGTLPTAPASAGSPSPSASPPARRPVHHAPTSAERGARGLPWRAIAIGVAVLVLAGVAALVWTGRETDETTRVASGSSGAIEDTPAAAAIVGGAPTGTGALPVAADAPPATEPAAFDDSASLPADELALAATDDAAVGAPGASDDPEALDRALSTGVSDPVATLLALGRADLAAQRYAQPPGRNALERFGLAARLAEHHRGPRDLERARQGIADVASGYVELAEKRRAEGDERQFLEYLARASEIAASVPQGAAVAARIEQRRGSLRDEALAAARAAVAAWDRNAAAAAYERALAFDASSDEARRGLVRARRIGEPGYVFRDATKSGEGPELVVVKVGDRRIAAARRETSVAEFKRYWQARGARARSDRPTCRDRESFFRGGRGRDFANPGIRQDGTHPVVCVAWGDAADYAAWLSEQTGKRYRLPTGAEFAALARGAVAPSSCRANVADSRYRQSQDERDAYGCDDGHAGTAPVASYDASPSGVHDAVGNVREWVSDCAPGCREHGAIGTAWFTASDKPDPLQRVSFGNDVASNTVGFRVVREID